MDKGKGKDGKTPLRKRHRISSETSSPYRHATPRSKASVRTRTGSVSPSSSTRSDSPSYLRGTSPAPSTRSDTPSHLRGTSPAAFPRRGLASHLRSASPTSLTESDTSYLTSGTLEPLKVLSCDGRHDTNHRNHHTELYELAKRKIPTHLVLRRGSVIMLILQLDRPYTPHDSLSAIFKYKDCKDPMVGQSSLSVIPLKSKDSTNRLGKWKAWVQSSVGTQLHIRVLPPADCIVGRWQMEIDSQIKKREPRKTFIYEDLFYMLFNPYCKEDDAYLEPKLLDEYLLKDIGLIYKGSRSPKPTHWVYGQFAKNVLDCCYYLMNIRAKLSVAMRSDPVAITRGLTAVVHSEFEPGVLLGNWSGDYSDGTRPQLWSGSAPILQQYYSNPEPVKYGQCWVYAGVMTTLCRSLGLAARCVTCYSCGFGPDDTVSIDVHYFENPEMAGKKNHRAFWNYHVWTEAWFKRSDIGTFNDGWQVLDASPQFPSAGITCLGPAPVVAIKDGKFRTPYDSGFVYHEVNGDIHYWKSGNRREARKLVGTNKKSVGWFIGTKGQNTWTIENITNNYKLPSMSKKELHEKFKELVWCDNDNTRYRFNQDFNEVEFLFNPEREVDIGQPITCDVILKNKHSWKTHLISARMVIKPILYTGESKGVIRFEKFEIPLGPRAEITLSLAVPYDVYSKHMLSDGLFNCACHARIDAIDYDFYEEGNIQVVQPAFQIKVPHAYVGETVTGTAEFVNPLNVSLTNGIIFIQGHFFKEVQQIKIGKVPPKQKVTITFDLTPLLPGEYGVGAKFASDQLSEVEGFARIVAVNKP